MGTVVPWTGKLQLTFPWMRFTGLPEAVPT